jgi:hypothetical protein
MQKPKKMTRDDIQGIVSDAVMSAVDFIQSEVEGDRLKAQRYFDGEVDIGHEEGRSKIVATKCRDVVRAIKPPLMRAFMASDKPVEFVPRKPEDVAAAEQATSFAQWKFNQINGYRLIYDAIHDAAVKKCGVIKVYYEDHSEAEYDEYSGLTEEQVADLAMDPELEILEYEQDEDTTFSLKVKRTRENGEICAEAIAPEDFFVNREATCIEDAYVCGHRNSEMRVGDLVAMGYDFEEVIQYAGDYDDAYQDEVDMERSGYDSVGEDDGGADPSMKKVLVTEAYMKMDIEGEGIPVLYRFLLIGSKYHVLDYDHADMKPFAVFEIDPEPHTFFGRSLVDLIMDDQDAATAMLRGVLDNVALTNTPRMEVLDGQANMEDVLNNEIGGIVRVKTLGAVNPLSVPFTAGSVLPALQYYDEQIENKTGVSRASMGLDPDALQNTTATAVQATTEAATGQVELIARNLAEGGMKQLFKMILKLSRQHTNSEVMMRLNGQFVPVDPRSWSVDMDLIANVGLGTGGEIEREMVLRETLQHQMSIWQAYGPTNGLVTLTQIRNTLADIMKLGGVQNSDRYWMPMTPEVEQFLMQQAQQAQQGQPDPMQAMAQAEVQKAQIEAQTRLQAEQMKMQQRGQADLMKAQINAQVENMKNDRERDKMLQDLGLEAARIFGEYGIKIDDQRIKREQAANNAQM